jgi:hypothetical protein
MFIDINEKLNIHVSKKILYLLHLCTRECPTFALIHFERENHRSSSNLTADRSIDITDIRDEDH